MLRKELSEYAWHRNALLPTSDYLRLRSRKFITIQDPMHTQTKIIELGVAWPSIAQQQRSFEYLGAAAETARILQGYLENLENIY